MATNKKFIKNIRKMSRKTWSGILYVWNRPFLVSAILLVLAVFLIFLLVTQAFKPYFKCAFLVGSEGPLKWDNLCKGYSITVPVVNFSFTILPELSSKIDPSLETFRKFIAYIIIIFFALVSLVLAFIVGKITGFIKFALTPEGRKIILTNLSTWLFIFVVLSTWFYFAVIK